MVNTAQVFSLAFHCFLSEGNLLHNSQFRNLQLYTNQRVRIYYYWCRQYNCC